ncbi:low molecular weight phosphatase family protein [Bythopirellula goksoeyrii]
MDEIDIDISDQYSKNVSEYLGRLSAHYLIVVCENAEENCPRLFPGMGQRLFWPFDDPAAVEASEEEQLSAFRRIRDELDERLAAWLTSFARPQSNASTMP